MNRTTALPLDRPMMKYMTAALAASVLFAAGCANMATTATGGGSFAQGASVTGTLHGGNQPVGYATVQVYTVGQTGVGSSGTLLATTTTDAGGNFTFTKQTSGTYSNTGSTYSCPSNSMADPELYIIARGGNTTGAGGSAINNSAAVFLAPLGYCSMTTSSQYVVISEATTVATVAALAQFINPSTEMIGNDGIGVAYQAIQNAVNTVPNLVSYASGLANTSTTITAASGGTGVTGATVAATPNAAKLNTIANILSSCINQVSSTSATNCSTLFASAPPPSNTSRTSQPGATFPTAADTLQAALYMFLNPTDGSTSNRTALYNLSSATGAPFQPTITSVPTDWTIAISYASTSTCGSGAFFNQPDDIKFDLQGNAWVANAGGSLVEMSASGTPTSCAALGGKGTSTIVDTAGNVWYTDNTNSIVYRYTPSSNTTRTYPVTGNPLAIAANAAGDVFFTAVSGTTGFVYQIANGANATGVNTPNLISNTVGANPAAIFPDSSYDLWVTSGSNYATFVSPGTSGTNFLNGYTSTPFTVSSPTYGVTVGPGYRAYITSRDPAATLTVLTPANGSYTVASGFPVAANTGGLSNPTGVSLDGGLNSWIGNGSTESSTGLYALSVIAVDGTSLTASGNSNGGYQKSAQYLNAVRATIVDSAGNVWTVNDGNPNSVTEVLGAAVPVYQPYSSALANNRFQTIP